MLLPLAVVLSLAGSDPAPPLTADVVLAMDGAAYLATGYCTTPGKGGAPPGGPMYLALGLVATGITVLRTERRARPPEP